MRNLTILALIGLPTLAIAVDLDPFEPAGSIAHGNGGIATESATLAGEGIALGLVGSIANDLMVIRFPSSGSETPFFSQAFGTTLYAGYTYKDTFRIELFTPLYLGVNVPGVSYKGFATGDMVLQGNIPVWQPSDAFNLALLPGLGLPTGSQKALLRQGVSGRFNVAMSGDFDFGFGYAANLGTSLTSKGILKGVNIGSSFDLRTAAWYAPTDEFRVGIEYDSRFSFVSNNHIAEGRLFAKVISQDGISLSVAAGRGLIAGVGAPDYRIVSAITYGPTARDRDKDSILDRDDSCPMEPEDFDGFEDIEGCPDPDNDQDTLLDADDSCPMEPEDFDGFEDIDGCPDPDNDEDGLLDADDRCPNDAGPEETQGCPDSDEDGIVDVDDQCPSVPGIDPFNGCSDTDMDLVPDYRDVCPDEKGPEDEDPEISDGCPKEAYVTRDRIKFNQRILFKYGKDTIKPQSFGLLDAIGSIMSNNPHVTKVEVGGHTDDVGADPLNLDLSNRRAASVKNYLIEHGISPQRLSSQGYGETEPMDSNRTEFGRANNRRVEFKILEQGERQVQERSISENMSYSWLSIVLPDAVKGFVTIRVNGEELPHRAPIERMLIDPGEREVAVEGFGLNWVQSVTVDRAQIYTLIVPDSALNAVKTIADPPSNEVLESDLPLAIPVGDEVDSSAPTEDATPPEEAGSSEDEPIWSTVPPNTAVPEAPPQAADISATNENATAEPEPESTTGSVSVLLNRPGNAQVFIDGLEINQSAPLNAYPLGTGPHAIRVVNEDRGLNHIEVIQVQAGQDISMSLQLEPLPEPETPVIEEVPTLAPVTDTPPQTDSKKKKKKKSKKKAKKKGNEPVPATEMPVIAPEANEAADVPQPEPETAEPEATNSEDPWGTESDESPKVPDEPSPESENDDPWSQEETP